MLPQLCQPLATGQDRDIVAALLQPRSKEATQRPRTIHQDLGHVRPSLNDVRAALSDLTATR